MKDFISRMAGLALGRIPRVEPLIRPATAPPVPAAVRPDFEARWRTGWEETVEPVANPRREATRESGEPPARPVETPEPAHLKAEETRRTSEPRVAGRSEAPPPARRGREVGLRSEIVREVHVEPTADNGLRPYDPRGTQGQSPEERPAWVSPTRPELEPQSVPVAREPDNSRLELWRVLEAMDAMAPRLVPSVEPSETKAAHQEHTELRRIEERAPRDSEPAARRAIVPQALAPRATIAATLRPRSVTAEEPVVKITIGRLEVKSVFPPAPSAPAAPARPPGPTLDEYLRKSAGGRA
jgi:hypothetical protein